MCSLNCGLQQRNKVLGPEGCSTYHAVAEGLHSCHLAAETFGTQCQLEAITQVSKTWHASSCMSDRMLPMLPGLYGNVLLWYCRQTAQPAAVFPGGHRCLYDHQIQWFMCNSVRLGCCRASWTQGLDPRFSPPACCEL